MLKLHKHYFKIEHFEFHQYSRDATKNSSPDTNVMSRRIF